MGDLLLTEGTGFSTTDTFSKGKLLIVACFVHPQAKMRWRGILTSTWGHRTSRSWAMILCLLRATWALVLGPVLPGIWLLLLLFFRGDWRQPWFVINQKHFPLSPNRLFEWGCEFGDVFATPLYVLRYFLSWFSVLNCLWLNVLIVLFLPPPCSHASSMLAKGLTDKTGDTDLGYMSQN